MQFGPMLNSGLSLKSTNEVASMFRKSLAVCISLAFAVSLTATGGETPSEAKLSAAAIVEKNVAARGGLQAWRAVQTMSMQGDWAPEGIGELRFLFQFRTKSPADSRSLHGRPRRSNCRLTWN